MAPAAAHASRDVIHKWLLVTAIVLVATLPLLHLAVTVPLSPEEQAQVSVALLLVAVLVQRRAAMRPMIIFLSAFASMRYFYWRVTSTVNLDNPLDATVSLLLLGAETYGVAILFLGYFQTVEVTRPRIPPPRTHPDVDVFIATYNESLDIVRRTAIGALAIEYPLKTVYILDDGRRPEMKAMAEALGCEYISRPDNRHAKAGNLNHALTLTRGEFIAVFDADHVPVKSFLQQTMGAFEDRTVALVQAAQHFFNPDPYERNLGMVGRMAPEQAFFYRVIQPGNAFWNSAFFCGSCAVLRRSALETIGGFKTATVTEDAHTALELHARGFRSVYQPLPLAAGLAPETFAAHVKQRIRWARGMAQILRVDCPLFKRGLSLPQRLNYFNAIAHFFFGIPRLILIVAPLTYLLIGAHPIKADAIAVFAYILPHIGLSMVANSIISRRHRHSFWAAVYEVSIAPFTAGVTLLALIDPRLGTFNVTDKGTLTDEARFDVSKSVGTLVLLGLSAAGLMVALPIRLVLFGRSGSDPAELHAMLINGVWAIGNFVVLLAAACVAYEQRQRRAWPRLARAYRCQLRWHDQALPCQTTDVSEGGVRITLPRPIAVPEQCTIEMADQDDARVTVTASLVRRQVMRDGRVEAAFRFGPLDPVVHRQLVEIIFCHPDSWIGETYPPDQLLRSLWYLTTTFWRVTARRRGTAGARGDEPALSQPTDGETRPAPYTDLVLSQRERSGRLDERSGQGRGGGENGDGTARRGEDERAPQHM